MTHDEIVNLGNLVNLRVSESESKDIIPKMESILGYIDQIKSVDVPDIDILDYENNPMLRNDSEINDTNFSEDFLSGVPNKENGYVKVNKVLGSE